MLFRSGLASGFSASLYYKSPKQIRLVNVCLFLVCPLVPQRQIGHSMCVCMCVCVYVCVYGVMYVVVLWPGWHTLERQFIVAAFDHARAWTTFHLREVGLWRTTNREFLVACHS